MQYVATRELKVVEKGRMVTYKAGDAIPSFKTWDYPVQVANLNLEWVKKVMPGEEPTPTQDYKNPNAYKSSAPKTEPVKQAKPPKKEAGSKKKASIPAVAEFKCDVCGKTGFKSAKALKTHITLAHGKKKE